MPKFSNSELRELRDLTHDLSRCYFIFYLQNLFIDTLDAVGGFYDVKQKKLGTRT